MTNKKFFLSSNQLKIHDAIHQCQNISLRIPRSYGLTYYVAYLVYLYRSIDMMVISPNSNMESELLKIFDHFTKQSPLYNNRTNNIFYSLDVLEHSSFCGFYNKEVIIYPEFSQMRMSTEHKNFINRICMQPNIKLILLCQSQ